MKSNFKRWLEENFTEFFTGWYEYKDNPDRGSWTKKQLKEQFKALINRNK